MHQASQGFLYMVDCIIILKYGKAHFGEKQRIARVLDDTLAITF